MIAQKQMCEMANQRARQQTRTHLGILSVDSERQAHGEPRKKTAGQVRCVVIEEE